MRVLLDTCVVSETIRPNYNKQVRARVEEIADEDLFLSVLTVGELAKGVEALESGRRKNIYGSYLLHLEQAFGDRILDLDIDMARLWGEMAAKAFSRGKTIPPVDGLIAATAARHGLAVMTRNVNDFEVAGVRTINPWE
ncbi:MAG: type II toxin-antitoxin system VapC family toxin [bacterium]|nr:type II toxin-antitoxin system VapC family toxin [bacterium]